MVIPGWRYLVSGGTTDQYLAKISSADGDYEWRTPSGGGSPGGSDTQIQYNNAGVFTGSANLTYDQASETFQFQGSNALLLIDAAGGGVTLAGTGLTLRSNAGQTVIGDDNGVGNSTVVTVDDPSARIVLSAAKPVIGNTTGNGQYVYDTGTATYWQWQSVNGVWTGTDTTSGSLP